MTFLRSRRIAAAAALLALAASPAAFAQAAKAPAKAPAAAAAASVGAARVVPATSRIAFTAKQMGVPVEGFFRKWSAQMSFDPKKPEAGKVAFAIDTGSATFGSPETDAEVVKSAWFDSAKFPQATFASTSIKAAGPGRYEVRGLLTIKGQAREVVVPVAFAQQGTGGTATGSFSIKRLAFKIGDGEWSDTSMVADDVTIAFKLTLADLPS